MMNKPLLLLYFFTSLMGLQAQNIQFRYKLEPHYTIVERADYSSRVNGNYGGYVNREIRGIFNSTEDSTGRYRIEGTWYLAKEIKKEGRYQALPLDGIEESSFLQDLYGNMSGFQGVQGPQFRNFPVFPREAVSFGDRWEAPLSMIITDLQGDQKAEIPLFCGYEFQGEGEYQDRQVYFINAQFAVRYRQGNSPLADRFLKNVSGSHQVTLTIDKETLSPILYRDSFKEQWQYLNGESKETRGFNLVFYDGVSLLNRKETLDNLARDLGDSIEVVEENSDGDNDTHEDRTDAGNFAQNFQESDITVYERNDGLTLSLNNLHFVPDQALLLSQDRPMLDSIAQSLLRIPEKTFLVTGHTADVGTRESQILLSLERARVVVQELIDRGIPAERFLYLGMGGAEPLSDNSTEEGMALNRRVEITILED